MSGSRLDRSLSRSAVLLSTLYGPHFTQEKNQRSGYGVTGPRSHSKEQAVIQFWPMQSYGVGVAQTQLLRLSGE